MIVILGSAYGHFSLIYWDDIVAFLKSPAEQNKQVGAH